MRKLISFSGLCFLILRLIYFFPFVITFLPYSKSIWIRFRNGKWNNSSLFCFCTSVQQLVHQHCVQEAADTKTWFIPLTNAISDTSTVSKILLLLKFKKKPWTIFFFFFPLWNIYRYTEYFFKAALGLGYLLRKSIQLIFKLFFFLKVLFATSSFL